MVNISYGKSFLVVSVFQFVPDYPDRVDPYRFALGMEMDGDWYYMRDRKTIQLTATGGWNRRLLRFEDCVGAWTGCSRDQTNYVSSHDQGAVQQVPPLYYA